MKSTETKYRCAKCDTIFADYWYNHYQFNDGSFVTCPNCDTKLVINFDFKNAVELTGLYLKLSYLIVMLVLVSMIFWGVKSVGVYVLGVGCIILIPLSYYEEYIRAPELFPSVKETVELESKKDA